MPNNQKHRGNHPRDEALFTLQTLPEIKDAVGHLSWLLSRGYAENSALKLVGDRFQLKERQRKVVMRAACPDQSLKTRRSKQRALSEISGEEVWIDGFNLLITIESALSGGFLFIGRDGCYRDNASIHGSYRKVEETLAALTLVGNVLNAFQPAKVRWLLDQPVSNSGRLAGIMRELAIASQWNWEVSLVQSPDHDLAACGKPVISTDGIILNNASGWINFLEEIREQYLPDARVWDLRFD